jgi:hypothetical protein
LRRNQAVRGETVTWIAVGLVAVALALAAVTLQFDRRIIRETDLLLRDAHPAAATPLVSEDRVRDLPAPVQRWLRHAGVIGTAMPTTVRLRQQGQFDLGRGWMPFRAEQYFTIDPPGFLWRASFRMAPLVWVLGRDQYRAGVASMDMRLFSLLPVARKSGGGLNQGDLLRFLGEMQWFPATALAEYISWQAVDDHAARATMTYGGVTASMVFRFDADGRLVEESALRYNDARGRDEQWINRNDSEREFQRIRIPDSGEARWEYDNGPFPYIRWTITDIDFARAAPYER